MKRHPLHHIAPRVFLQLLALLAAVFACIFLAFNLFFKNYLDVNVRSQLDAISANMTAVVSATPSPDERHPDADGTQAPARGALREHDLSLVLKNTIRSEARVFNLNGSYVLTDYDDADDPAELKLLAAELQERQAPLDSARYVHAVTSAGDYYVSSITDPVLPDTYMVFALDVSAMRSLWNTVNAALAAIMAAALLICLAVAWAIAGSVTGPVRQLSAFAESLGGGDFSRRGLRFGDEEFNELAAAMDSAAERLGAYDCEQRTFFQNVSHELRTPLMSIRCYAEGISCGVMEPASSGAVILAETDRLSGLVEDLLYISRIDRTPAPDKMQQIDLRETVSLCATGQAAVAQKNGIALQYDFDAQPVLFTCNENHFCRAVDNLLSNALRYAKSSATLSCHAAAGAVEITVADDGPGVAPEDLPHVFERFYKGRGGKAGIGLAIVRSVAELYGGTATAAPGPGGRFTLRFPDKGKTPA